MRVGIYERISMDRSGEAAGVQRQDEDCKDLADELTWELIETYVDNDISATSGKPRPAYRRMLNDIEAGRLDAIIAWHVDRLYRTVRDLEELVDIAERHHIAIRTCRAGDLDLSTPTGRMIARILGATAQHEVEQKADRWRRGFRQRRQAGQWIGGAPRTFGYNGDGTIRADEAAIGKQIVEWVLEGVPVQSICRRLREQGAVTTRGNIWDHTALRKWLRNPRIAGLSTLDGEIIGAGQWDALIDRPTWERVRAVIETRNHTAPIPRRWALLSNLAFCGVEGCGRRLYRTRKNLTTWTCRTGTQSNGHVAIVAEPLERMVEAYAREKLADDKIRAAIAARTSSAGTAAGRLIAEIDALDTEIRELEAQFHTAGSRSRITISQSIDQLDEQLKAKRQALATLTPVELPVGDEWPDDLERRATLVRLVVQRVTVYPAKHRGGRFDPERVKIDPVEFAQ